MNNWLPSRYNYAIIDLILPRIFIDYKKYRYQINFQGKSMNFMSNYESVFFSVTVVQAQEQDKFISKLERYYYDIAYDLIKI